MAKVHRRSPRRRQAPAKPRTNAASEFTPPLHAAGNGMDRLRDEDRRALARALHDEVGQLLTGVRLEVAGAIDRFREAPGSDTVAVVDHLQAAVGLLDLSIDAVRRLATSLRPAMLDHLGFVESVRWEAALFERRTGIRCRLSTPSTADDWTSHATVLHRILLEALTNVARHAHAGTVRIMLRRRTQSVSMEVRDNGRGIDAGAIADPQMIGLAGMRERAHAAGGQVRIARLPAGGTSVLVTLPSGAAPSTRSPVVAPNA